MNAQGKSSHENQSPSQSPKKQEKNGTEIVHETSNVERNVTYIWTRTHVWKQHDKWMTRQRSEKSRC